MAKFIVTADQIHYYTFEVIVDANSKEEAEKLVRDNIEKGVHDNSWEFDMVGLVSIDVEQIS